MKRFLNLSRRSTSTDSGTEHREDSAEAIILRELTAFCESESNSNSNGASRDAQGNEFVHLPKIVETAESSPNAAKEAALRIRKYLADPAGTPNHTQYNAIMLMRILADNPGHTFTRNIDAKFVTTIKELLRTGRDWHVQSYLRQYLDALEQQRSWDEDLKLLLQMWSKEKTKASRGLVDRFPTTSIVSPPIPPQHPRQTPPRILPDPVELAARIEEGRTTAKLLTQFVQSTPPVELEDNDLIKEFIDRCRTSSRQIQSYIHATNPAPDEETLLTLIETNDEIAVALSQQQRAMLKARKIRGSSSPSSSNLTSPSPTSQGVSGVAGPATRPPPRSPESSASAAELPSTTMSGGRASASNAAAPAAAPAVAPAPAPARYEYNSADFQVRNPFADDYATHDSDQEMNRHHGDRVRVQPTEQER